MFPFDDIIMCIPFLHVSDHFGYFCEKNSFYDTPIEWHICNVCHTSAMSVTPAYDIYDICGETYGLYMALKFNVYIYIYIHIYAQTRLRWLGMWPNLHPEWIIIRDHLCTTLESPYQPQISGPLKSQGTEALSAPVMKEVFTFSWPSEYGILFLHIFSPLGCFCPRVLFSNNH